MTQAREHAVLNEPVERRSANFQLMLLNKRLPQPAPLRRHVERHEDKRLLRVRWLFIESYEVGIAGYLASLACGDYSPQTLRALLVRNLHQEEWNATEGLPLFRDLHADNAALIHKALHMLGGAM